MLSRKLFHRPPHSGDFRLRTIQHIVSDMDGTLLNDYEKIGDTTAELINALDAAGIPFVIATRRHHVAVEAYIAQLHTPPTIISLDGAVIRVAGTPAPLYTKEFDQNFALDILDEILATPGVDYCAITPDIYYVSRQHLRIPSHHEHPGIPQELHTATLDIHRVILEIVVSGDYFGVNQIYSYLEQKMKKGELNVLLYESRSERDVWFMEITSASATKLHAVEWLANHTGIGLKNIAGIGDHVNDIEFCGKVGYVVALQNAVSPLKKMADFITKDDFRKEGINEFLTYFLNVRNITLNTEFPDNTTVRRTRSR